MKTPQILDVCTYNGEKDLFDLRHNILKDYVDQFIVVSFDKTFSGKPNSVDVLEYEKTLHITITEDKYSKYKELAESSPNTVGAEHWKREFMQKESLKDVLADLELNNKDIIVIGDVDEIWVPINLTTLKTKSYKLGLKVYTYYLNNRSSEVFYGPIVTRYGKIKDKCLNHFRTQSNNWELIGFGGWHFTSMGGYEEVKNKLTASYTKDSYWTPEVEDNLKINLENNKDFLGRDFTFKIDESEWPEYLKENKDKYSHLMK